MGLPNPAWVSRGNVVSHMGSEMFFGLPKSSFGEHRFKKDEQKDDMIDIRIVKALDNDL
jgi:hypothetical protein